MTHLKIIYEDQHIRGRDPLPVAVLQIKDRTLIRCTTERLPARGNWGVVLHSTENFSLSADDLAGITSIASHAFTDITNLVSATTPPTLIDIAICAFSGCTHLKSVQLNDGLESIGSSSFEHCAIEEINIPNTTIRIKHGAFHDCKNLTDVRIPKNLIAPEGRTFNQCGRLENIDLS